jgi:hypothetical protein
MKTLHAIIASLALVIAGGGAFAAEPVAWRHADYSSEFKYFQESGAFTPQSWRALLPEMQEEHLRQVKEPAGERQQAIQDYYDAAMSRWDAYQLKDYASQTGKDDLATVQLWLGPERAAALQKKLAITRGALDIAAKEGLTPGESAALRPYLTDEAIAGLRSVKAAGDLQRQADTSLKKHEIPKETVNSAMGGVSGAIGDHTGKSIKKIFDGSTASGDVADPVRPPGAAGRSYEIPREAMTGAVSGVSGQLGAYTGKSVAGALGTNQPRATAATTVKSAAPKPLGGAADKKSTAWTSDAYGYTITANGQTRTYRDQKEAEAAIRALPNGSVSKMIFYGHGAPGSQSVGNASYEAGDTAQLLKGKMAHGGVIQYSGCNTASIGGATLNPAVGISMVTRRLLYFSVPYWQDRMSGVPADEAKQQWEKGWNADLSRDTSVQMKGAIVCGYRTFGLVPGRMPGLTKLQGNQEATTPGYVAGKMVCYQDGREVPEP